MAKFAIKKKNDENNNTDIYSDDNNNDDNDNNNNTCPENLSPNFIIAKSTVISIGKIRNKKKK